MPTLVLAVVEIADSPFLLLIAAIFIVTFIGVCALAYRLLPKARRDGDPPTWNLQVRTRLPVSTQSFDRIAKLTEAAVRPPEISPATRTALDQLDGTRHVFATTYRTLMIAVGIAAIVGGGLLLRSHTPANQQGLPGGIVLLLGLGALMSGLVPGRSVVPGEPLSPDLRRQMREQITVQVTRPGPLELTLDEQAMQRAAQLLRDGVPVTDTARAVCPSYDALSDAEQRWVESTLEQCARTGFSPRAAL